MKNIITLILPLLFYSHTLYATNTIEVATGEWSPYTTQIPDRYLSGEEGGYGMVLEIVSAVLHEMNLTPQYVFLDWTSSSQRVADNQIKIGFPYVHSEDREKVFIYSDALLDVQPSLYFNIHKTGQVPHVSQLGEYTVGIVSGYEYPEVVRRYLKNTKQFSDEFVAFQALIAGQIQILPSELKVGDNFMNRYFVSDKEKIDRITGFAKPRSVHLVAGKKAEDAAAFIQRFNSALQSIRNKGIYAAILSKYEHRQDSLFVVRLLGTSAYPMVMGTITNNSQLGYLIPDGTRAAVVEWNKIFTEADSFNVNNEMLEKSKVRLLDGPLKGKELWVPNLFLSFK